MKTNPISEVSRRRFLAATALTATGLWLMPRRAAAGGVSPVITLRQQALTARITVTKLRGHVSVLEGSGGNIGVLTGGDGKFLVDAGITGSRPALREALGSLGPEPVNHVVNTHYHFDHTDGNEWLHAEGATILAHENTRRHLTATTRVEPWDFTFPPSPPGALPTAVISDKGKLFLNGTTIALQYYGPCHTDGDLSVEFVEADILQTGDTFWNGYYPFIDYGAGGGIDGAIRAAESNLARVSDKTIVIPGHGPIGDKAALLAFREMLVTVRERVAALKKSGRSEAETVAARPTADLDALWGGFVLDGATFTKLVYAGV